MPKVLVLPDHIASQIAAGEVVERPASVVKELVENSLDAGATAVEVAVSAHCRDIRIADNGCGMAAEDAVLAFQRHATSKIKSVDDLWTLRSFGFRGEALPSIASIAHVACTTRTRDAQSGVRAAAADGKVSVVETGCAPGTVMEVTDLFYNVPARLNFLRKAATEFAHIQETLQSLAIAHPEVAIHLINQRVTAFKTTGSGDLSAAATEAGLFSGQEALCQFEYDEPHLGVHVCGTLAQPLHFRGDRKGIVCLVNKRPVRCHLTYKALDYSFSDLIPRGRHPLAVVAIEINPDQIDVNIHPTKKEIKYTSANEIYMAIQRALTQALRQERMQQREAAIAVREATDPIIGASYAGATMTAFIAEPAYAGPAARVVEAERMALSASAGPEQISFRDQLSYLPSVRSEKAACSQTGETGALDSWSSEQSTVAASELKKVASMAVAATDSAWQEAVRLPADWRIAGYIHNTYILIENSQGLLLVEQHIAHERTLYERILAAQAVPGRLSEHSQRLIISAALSLSFEQSALLAQHHAVLSSLGFDFETNDNGETVCTQVPIELAYKNYAAVVQEMISQIATADGANIDLEATKSIACQSAIKNGMPLDEREIVKLLSDWLATPRNDTCPHGRPITLKLTHEKLFQLFHPA